MNEWGELSCHQAGRRSVCHYSKRKNTVFKLRNPVSASLERKSKIDQGHYCRRYSSAARKQRGDLGSNVSKEKKNHTCNTISPVSTVQREGSTRKTNSRARTRTSLTIAKMGDNSK